MHKLRNLLPSGNSLFTFEAAARHESFTEAAQELNVSQPAISKAVAQLEGHLGTRLFHRQHRAIALTPAGRRFYREVSASLDHLYGAALELGRAPAKESLEVSFSGIFVALWLVPRLQDFKARYPNLRLHVEVNDREDKNLAREGIDLSMRLGDGLWSGQQSWRFVDEEVFPVCSPRYLAAQGPIEVAAALPGHRLLQLDEPHRVRIGWKEWLHQKGVGDARLDYDLVFTDAEALMQTALHDQGVALGWRHLVDDLLREGRLVRPVRDSYRSGLALYLTAPEPNPMKWGARVFRDWMLEQAGESP